MLILKEIYQSVVYSGQKKGFLPTNVDFFGLIFGYQREGLHKLDPWKNQDIYL